MKLRESNKRKSFLPSNYFPQLDSSDDDPQGPVEERDDSSEDGFVDRDPEASDADKDNDAQLEDTPESESEAPSDDERILENRRRRLARKLKLQDEQVERTPGEVQPYPSDPAAKWTRTYIGPVARHARLPDLCMYWYSDRDGYEKVINGFLFLWAAYELCLPRVTTPKQQKLIQNPWMPENFPDDQEKKFLQWYANYLATRRKPQISVPILQMTASRWYLPLAETELTALLGPFDGQKEYIFEQGRSILLSRENTPIEQATDGEDCGGYLIDMGGITLSMGWAPRNGQVDQLLALAVVPYSDQAFYQTPEEASPGATLKQGSIQIWKIPAQRTLKGSMCLAGSRPQLFSALCFEWGRAVRMQWCPVPLTARDHIGLLALLTGDGKVRVVEVKQSQNKGNQGTFEEVVEPLATIELIGEHNVEVTCFTWINMNRIAVGHSDGSIAVWSVYPCMMLQRHPIHSTHVIDITSGYPSHPFIVATMPVGGVATVTDLSRPNAELTYCSNLVVALQPNLLAWSEHMRGYVSIWPSSMPSNNVISFMAARTFPQTRFLLVTTGQPTCLAVGACHPYVLVGSTDGSLWLVNFFRKIFFYKKKSNKLKLFQHDYLASPEARRPEDDQEVPRGVCRILYGFKPQGNGHPKAERGGTQVRRRHEEQKKANKKAANEQLNMKGKDRQYLPTGGKDENGTVDVELEEEVDGITLTAHDVTIQDPLQRISAITWNPNVEFSWWAAAAMGSGLVRIMDLGVEQDVDAEQHPQPGRRFSGAGEEENTGDEIDERFVEESSEDEEGSEDEPDDIAMQD
ncbi:hypothetical protein BJ170DRAFT_12571 [Xylariales sp. AK1849]|nr:hypothetical protein BJ170DRAFT_12571 [Xylariales sp. AK1849]